MAGNIFDHSSAVTERDPLRWCKAGQHQLRKFRADGTTKICAVCKLAFDADGKAIEAAKTAQ